MPVVTKEGSIFSIVATVPVFAYVTLSDLRCKKMAINKKIREAVYKKYGGRCAYCGRAIAYKDMQVDHFFFPSVNTAAVSCSAKVSASQRISTWV